MPRVAFAIVVLACTAVTSPVSAQVAADAGANAADPSMMLADARDALDRGEVARAIASLERLVDAADVRRSAQARFLLGDAHERTFDFERALGSYRASVERDSGGRYAARALARIEYLSAHAEGAFVPLATLERVRSNPSRASNLEAVRQLERSALSFPPGPVRSDALLLVAQAYVGRLHRPIDALRPLRSLARDPATPASVRQLSAELLVQAHGTTRLSRALIDDLERLGADPSLIARVRRLIRRDKLRVVALAVVALVIAYGAWSVASATRRSRGRELARAWLRPLPLAHLAVLSLGGAALAHTYDSHDMRPFFGFGAGALVAYLAMTAGNVAGGRNTGILVARATLGLASVLAISFLAMDRYDPGMLDGIAL